VSFVGNFGIGDVGCGKVHWENENVGSKRSHEDEGNFEPLNLGKAATARVGKWEGGGGGGGE
jgi:hypothetical protein